jgi:hypothetical protein
MIAHQRVVQDKDRICLHGGQILGSFVREHNRFFRLHVGLFSAEFFFQRFPFVLRAKRTRDSSPPLSVSALQTD